jgi:hypothetical protein
MFYYIWKNNLKSDIIGFCQYRRYFHHIDYDAINDNKIQVYTLFEVENIYQLALSEGINDYILISLKKFLHDKYDYSNEQINDALYTTKNTSFVLMYCCKWNIFEKLCEFVFGFLNYLLPNEEWKTIDGLDNFTKEINYCYNEYCHHIKSKYNIEPEWYKAILSKRSYAHIIEILINVFFILNNYEMVCSEYDLRKDIFIILDKNNYSLEKLYKFHDKNIYSNYGSICCYTEDENIKNEIINNSNWYELNKIRFVDEQPNNSIMLNINQYIDVDNPYDLNINNKYSIKLINA